jgi:hypothetical protein
VESDIHIRQGNGTFIQRLISIHISRKVYDMDKESSW